MQIENPLKTNSPGYTFLYSSTKVISRLRVCEGNKYKLSDENLWFRVSVLKALSINIQILKRTISSKFVVVSS